MAWVRIDDQAPHHRKMLNAGPAACWFWVCAIAHAQRQLTDGRFTRADFAVLGVPNPKKLIDALVRERLLDVDGDGWRVHDYLDYNDDRQTALMKREQRSQARRAAGSKGASSRWDGKADSKPNGTAGHDHDIAPVGVGGEIGTTQKKGVQRLDVAFANFRDAYPQNRRKGGHMAEQAFLQQVTLAGGVDPIMAALRNHIASAQWQDTSKIPNMDRWLTEERWRQSLPAEEAAQPSGPSEIQREFERKYGDMRVDLSRRQA